MPEPTPEQLGREAGEAIANVIADNLEAVLLKLADAIARVQAQQDALLNDVMTAERRLDEHHEWLKALDEHTARR